ncbi:hypothetical protein HK097_010670 [Rhizophlyctis rosea]|uniref:Carbohydrate kinase PfkB domain-containing protein n=1 Tax=Rhizophlyctis rosea TaxID=64517 RepID=A0AAD5X4Z3_9FUNG|nr:hypothetical protein HK097_010670 [Rhizophlyctis rosea]
MARAGAEVFHAGRVGNDGQWVVDLMKSHGVKTNLIVIDPKQPTGRAIIQVSSATSDNAIILNAGANHCISLMDINTILNSFQSGDWIVLQNEINVDAGTYVLAEGRRRGFITVFNPAPCPSDLLATWPLTVSTPDILILNETEAESLLSQITPIRDTANSSPALALLESLPNLRILIVTAGAEGAYVAVNSTSAGSSVAKVPALKGVKVVDTTGAGDTFVGYFVASLAKRLTELGVTELRKLDISEVEKAASLASAAAGLCCEKEGAMPSVPNWDDVIGRCGHV